MGHFRHSLDVDTYNAVQRGAVCSICNEPFTQTNGFPCLCVDCYEATEQDEEDKYMLSLFDKQ